MIKLTSKYHNEDLFPTKIREWPKYSTQLLNLCNQNGKGTTPSLNAERLQYIPQGGSMKDCPEHLRNNSDHKRAMRRLDLRQPSPTIVHNNCDHYYHPTESRRVTIREMARLQGYPDDYIFKGSKGEQSRQVGNSVPIPLAYNLALSTIKTLERNG